MKFSIIIPTYNRADKIKRCLDSIENQDVQDFEVIICDDGSTDNTFEIIKPYLKKFNLLYIKCQTPSKRAAVPRNIAASFAIGEWLAFLDSDDWWYPNKLSMVLPYLKEQDAVFHGLDTFTNAEKKLSPKRGRSLQAPVFHDLMINHNALITSATLVRREIFIKSKGFEEIDLEDYDLWLKISRMTDRFFYLDELLGGYWEGGGNTTATDEKEIVRLESIYEKHKSFLSLKNQELALCGLNYIKGRIFHKMGRFSEAKTNYEKAISSTSFRIKRNSLIFLALAILKIKK